MSRRAAIFAARSGAAAAAGAAAPTAAPASAAAAAAVAAAAAARQAAVPAASAAAAAAAAAASLLPSSRSLAAAAAVATSARVTAAAAAAGAAGGGPPRPAVLLPEEVDVNRVKFQEPRASSRGTQMHAFVQYEFTGEEGAAPTTATAEQPATGAGAGGGAGGVASTGPLRVQTPWLTLPFGASRFAEGSPWQLMLSLGPRGGEAVSPEAAAELAAFHDFVVRFEQRLLAVASQEAATWFPGKTLIPEVIAHQMKSVIVPPKDEQKYPPMFKARLKADDDGQPQCDVYAEGVPGTLPPLQSLQRGARASVILQCTGVWLLPMGFGCNWRAVQVKIDPNASSGNGGAGSGTSNNAPLSGPAFR